MLGKHSAAEPHPRPKHYVFKVHHGPSLSLSTSNGAVSKSDSIQALGPEEEKDGKLSGYSHTQVWACKDFRSR